MFISNIVPWDELKKRHPDITEESVKQVIRLNPRPINKKALKTLFNATPSNSDFTPPVHITNMSERSDLLARCLDNLANDNNSGITYSTNRGYRSEEPYADIAIATITKRHDDGTSIGHIDNLPHNLTMFSANQTRRHNLQEGQKYLVKIDRDKETGKLNLFPLDLISDKSDMIYMAGTHNKSSPTVRAADPTLKTIFRIAHNPSTEYIAHPILEIDTKTFDITNPTVSFAKEQNTDITSGRRISQILGQRYGLNTSHPFLAQEEAAYIAKKTIPPHGRKDYRNKIFFTIDPEDPNADYESGQIIYGDYDDAICVEHLNNNQGYRLIVAIADVPAFIHPGTPLDKAAYQRGTSYYFDDNTTYHMLPEELAINHLSLLGNHDRAVITVEFDFNNEGDMLDHNFNLATINSKKQMTYPSFDRAIKRKENFLTPSIELFTILSQRTNAQRKKHISSMLLLDDPTKLSGKKFVPTFMTLANHFIHQKILDHFGYSCFRNCGPLGEQSNYDKIRKVLTALNHNLPEKASECSWDTLDELIKQTSKQEAGEYDNVLTLLRTYLFARAYYSPDPLGHFPLGYDVYGHATSPLRRYPDIIALRMLHHILNPQSPAGKAYTREELDEITKHLNKISLKEKRIKAFENKFHIINNVKLHAKSGAKAIITDIDHDHIEVMHTTSGLVTDIMVNQPQIDELYFLNFDNLELIATDPFDGEQKTYRPGDNVSIRITEVDPTRAIWECELSEPPQFISKRTRTNGHNNTPRLQI